MFSLSKTRHLMSFNVAAQTPSASASRSCLLCTQHLWPETCLLGHLPPQIIQLFPGALCSRVHTHPHGAHSHLSNKHPITDNVIINSGPLKFQCHHSAVCLDVFDGATLVHIVKARTCRASKPI